MGRGADMPAWSKSPEPLQEAFSAALEAFPAAERRKMFGYPAAFANGKMWTGLHQQNWVIRLPEEHLNEMLTIDGATRFEPMPGRPMSGFCVIPQSILQDQAALHDWLRRAFEHAQTLEAKPARART